MKLSKEKVYLAMVKNVNEKKILYYPVYGLEEIDNTLQWFDGDRFRITTLNNKIVYKNDKTILITTTVQSISFTLLTLDLFEKTKEKVFATNIVLDKKFKNDNELQEFLINLIK